jgi:outer membrane lipoprotein-sorting protein
MSQASPSANAIAFPKPRLAPVMTATRPLRVISAHCNERSLEARVLTSKYMRFIGVFTMMLFVSGRADAQPDVRAILGKVSALYKSATQYEIIAESRSIDPTSDAGSGRARFVFQAPNRYRVEGSDSNNAETGAVIIDDGSMIWLYFPQTNQYNSIPVAALKDDAAGNLRDLRPESQDESAMSRYRQAESSQESKYLRDETIRYLGTQTDCYVVSISKEKGGSAHTWWIEKKSYRVLRDDDAEASVVFAEIKLGGPISEKQFKFVPPEGAHKVEFQP